MYPVPSLGCPEALLEGLKTYAFIPGRASYNERRAPQAPIALGVETNEQTIRAVFLLSGSTFVCVAGNRATATAGRGQNAIESGRRGAGLHLAGHGSQAGEVERFPGKQKRGAGLLRICLHRWLNARVEGVPGWYRQRKSGRERLRSLRNQRG